MVATQTKTEANQRAKAQPVASQKSSPILFGKQKVELFEKIIWLIAIACLVAVRIPAVLRGRFWAEEGSVFFYRAWNLPWYKALFLAYGGYLSLVGNLGGILANSLVPLEKACYVPTILALLVQLCPLIILSLSKEEWLQDRKFFLTALLLLVTMPMCEGVWLNTVGSQYHLNLCVAIILALKARQGLVGYFHKAILMLATLSGLGPACLVPLYALRALIDRSKTRAVECLILISGLLIQLCFFWRPEARHMPGVSAPTVGIDPLLLLNIVFVKHIVCPVLGYRESIDAAGSWMNEYALGTFNAVPGAVAAIVVFGVLSVWVWQSKLPETKWLFISGIALAALSYAAACGERYYTLGIGINTRYAYAPQLLFELTALTIWYSSNYWKSMVSKFVLVWLLVVGAHEYFCSPPSFSQGPIWRAEVRKWHTDPSYAMKIWPSGWAVSLKPRSELEEKVR